MHQQSCMTARCYSSYYRQWHCHAAVSFAACSKACQLLCRQQYRERQSAESLTCIAPSENHYKIRLASRNCGVLSRGRAGLLLPSVSMRVSGASQGNMSFCSKGGSCLTGRYCCSTAPGVTGDTKLCIQTHWYCMLVMFLHVYIPALAGAGDCNCCSACNIWSHLPTHSSNSVHPYCAGATITVISHPAVADLCLPLRGGGNPALSKCSAPDLCQPCGWQLPRPCTHQEHRRVGLWPPPLSFQLHLHCRLLSRN